MSALAHELNLVALIVATLLLFLGASSGLVNNRLWLSEPMLCVLVGIIAGPVGLGVLAMSKLPFDLDSASLAHEAARYALAVAVTGAALRLPGGYLRRHWRELSLVLTVGMLLMWVFSAALAITVLHWPLLPALLLAGALAPTDPVLSGAIVSGRFADTVISPRLRNAISAESGVNDGLAIALVLLPAMLMIQPSVDAAWLQWLLRVGRELGIALLIGTASGYASGRLLVWARRYSDVEMTSLVSLALVLAISTLSACRLLGTDGILACFVAGAWFNEALTGRDEDRHASFHHAISRFFELPFFVLFGALLPWREWQALGIAGMVFALLVLLIRRPLAWLLLWRWLPSLRNRRQAIFAGWFGPIGIAALFYALQWADELQLPELWSTASLVAMLSMLLHGITATPFSRRILRGAQ